MLPIIDTSLIASKYQAKQKCFIKKKMSHIAAANPTFEPDTDTLNDTEKISQLQKCLSDQINDNAWKEKECARLQERIKHLQEHNQASWTHVTCLEHAFVHIAKDGNAVKISYQ
jgi:hypothetical protein